ncbi:DUF2303 family protein [Escherichia coli]|nr:DUF2303 family protein [Escherichia coli]
MSQNLDATAINQIHALISAQGVNEIISKIGADAVALPENFRIHDLEKFNLNRFRFFFNQNSARCSAYNVENKMSFIKTFSGKHFYYDRINKDNIDINDIAVSLSNICRFAGHLSHFYSVAQHAVLCSQLVPQEFAFEALMHDATEAYCQDIPAPLKRLLPDYKRMEEKIDAVIREKYGLPPVMSTPVKYADLIMLATERRDLGLDDGSFWPVLEGIPATEMFNVIPLAPGHAYGMFMERFNELSELRKCA